MYIYISDIMGIRGIIDAYNENNDTNKKWKKKWAVDPFICPSKNEINNAILNRVIVPVNRV